MDGNEGMDGNDALIAAILAGETHRFREVVEVCDDHVRRVVERSIRDPDSREEIVQLAFARAFERLESLDAPARLQAWICRIASNCVTDFYRKALARRERSLSGRDAPAAAESKHSWIWEEARQLSLPQAKVLELRYQQGWSYAEISSLLDVPLSTVRGRIYEARKALRLRLIEKKIFP